MDFLVGLLFLKFFFFFFHFAFVGRKKTRILTCFSFYLGIILFHFVLLFWFILFAFLFGISIFLWFYLFGISSYLTVTSFMRENFWNKEKMSGNNFLLFLEIFHIHMIS